MKTNQPTNKIFLITNIVATVIVAAMAVAMVHIKAQMAQSSDFICPPYDSEQLMFFPNPRNCQGFYECMEDGTYSHQCCPEGLIFCAEKHSCSWPGDLDCDYYCITIDDCTESSGWGGGSTRKLTVCLCTDLDEKYLENGYYQWSDMKLHCHDGYGQSCAGQDICSHPKRWARCFP